MYVMTRTEEKDRIQLTRSKNSAIPSDELVFIKKNFSFLLHFCTSLRILLDFSVQGLEGKLYEKMQRFWFVLATGFRYGILGSDASGERVSYRIASDRQSARLDSTRRFFSPSLFPFSYISFMGRLFARYGPGKKGKEGEEGSTAANG